MKIMCYQSKYSADESNSILRHYAILVQVATLTYLPGHNHLLDMHIGWADGCWMIGKNNNKLVVVQKCHKTLQAKLY